MKLSEYCKIIKPHIEESCKGILEGGTDFNDAGYTSVVDFLDDCVLSLSEYVMKGDVEKDLDMAEALRQSGLVDGYLQNTNIMGKVVKSQNPLKGIFG